MGSDGRLRALGERLSESLFFLPAVFVLAAVVGAEGMLRLDAGIDTDDLPLILQSTVDSAREVLGTIASAVITVAGIVFSVTIVAVQLASSEFTPRVLHSYLRDRVPKLVMGFTTGTFAYCLFVLRTVRTEPDGADGPIIPNLSVALAVVLGVVAILVILAGVDHTIRMMRSVNIVNDVASRTLKAIQHTLPEGHELAPAAPEAAYVTSEESLVISAGNRGWVQGILTERILDAVGDGYLVRMEVRVGQFVIQGGRLATVTPLPPDGRQVTRALLRGVILGRTRTLQQDVDFGIRQLVDVSMRALSPGVNDPTTAYEAVVHISDLLTEVLRRQLPAGIVADDRGRTLVRTAELSHEDYVARAYDQIRVAGATQPSFVIALLGSLGAIKTALQDCGLNDRVRLVSDQATRVLSSAEHAGIAPHDLERVKAAAAAKGFV